MLIETGQHEVLIHSPGDSLFQCSICSCHVLTIIAVCVCVRYSYEKKLGIYSVPPKSMTSAQYFHNNIQVLLEQ